MYRVWYRHYTMPSAKYQLVRAEDLKDLIDALEMAQCDYIEYSPVTD